MQVPIEHLTKSFGDKTVLDDVSLTLKKGITMLEGPSGCGKTTFGRILTGLEKQDSGRFTKIGSISCLFQEPRLFPWLTVLENLTAATGCEKQSAMKLLEKLGLENEHASYPGELSGGMQRRVSLARTLLKPAEFYLFDEPLVGLDAALRTSVCELIRDTLPRDSVALIITHTAEEVKAVADFRLVMKDGKIYETKEQMD